MPSSPRCTSPANGERSADALRDAMRAEIGRAPLARIDYAEIVDADTLRPASGLSAEGASGGRYLAAVAVYFGDTRLIDNATIDVRDAG